LCLKRFWNNYNSSCLWRWKYFDASCNYRWSSSMEKRAIIL
jgi:hypothetical protein